MDTNQSGGAAEQHQRVLLADQWDECLPGSPEETCAMRACAAQLREVLRTQEKTEAKRADLLSVAVITFHHILKADDQGECCEIANWFLTTRAPALKAVGQPTYNRAALAQAGTDSEGGGAQ